MLKHKLSPGEWNNLERWHTLVISHKFGAAWSWRGTASPGISRGMLFSGRRCSTVLQHLSQVPASLQGFLPAFVIPRHQCPCLSVEEDLVVLNLTFCPSPPCGEKLDVFAAKGWDCFVSWEHNHLPHFVFCPESTGRTWIPETGTAQRVASGVGCSQSLAAHPTAGCEKNWPLLWMSAGEDGSLCSAPGYQMPVHGA